MTKNENFSLSRKTCQGKLVRVDAAISISTSNIDCADSGHHLCNRYDKRQALFQNEQCITESAYVVCAYVASEDQALVLNSINETI